MIFSRIWLINGLLAVALILSALNIWDTWSETPGVISRANSDPVEKQTRPGNEIPQKRLNSEAQYADIVDKNLFSPDRAPAPPESVTTEPEVEEVAEAKISGEKVALYGVIVLDDYKKALINDPADRAVEFRWVSEGDKIGNLAVREIFEDNILLSDNEKTYRILLYDPEKAARAAARNSVKAPAEAQPQIISAGSSSLTKTDNTSSGQAAKTSESSKAATKILDSKFPADEYEIVDTPFGKMRKKKK